MARLLLLEDERILREEIANQLRDCGHAVDSAATVAEFDRLYQPGLHIIALIDLGLPDGDGIDLIGRLRARGERLGIVVVSARGGSASKVHGLTTGADHYLSKPVDLDELAAVVGALARRLETGGVTQRWTLQARSRQLTPPGGNPISLTAQAYLVLNVIAAGHGQTVDRRQIVDALGEDFLQYDQRRLDTQMHQLRKQVSEAAGLELPVRSARGRGYQFIADIDLKP